MKKGRTVVKALPDKPPPGLRPGVLPLEKGEDARLWFARAQLPGWGTEILLKDQCDALSLWCINHDFSNATA